MRLGMGAKYFATFKAIQQIHLRREVSSFDVGDQLIQVAEDHQRDTHRGKAFTQHSPPAEP